MKQSRAILAACVAVAGALIAYWGFKDNRSHAVKTDLVHDLKAANVVLPTVPVERHIGFSNGRWEFDNDGHIRLTRQHPFSNRLDFLSSEGAGDVELSFHYQTRWTQAGEQSLSLVFHDAAAEDANPYFGISIQSDGQIRVQGAEFDASTGKRKDSTLAASQPLATTNEDWHRFRLRVTSTGVSVELDGETTLTCALPSELSQRVGSGGSWSLAFTRTGPGMHRTQARLADLEARFDGAGREPEIFNAFPTSPERAAADANFLIMKYRIDRAHFEESLKHLKRKIVRPLGEGEVEHITGWFAPPGSTFQFTVEAEPGDRLQARYGFDFGEALSEEPPATFYVRAYWANEERELFRHEVSGSDQLERGDLFRVDVPVPADASTELTIELGVLADPSAEGEGSPLRRYATFFASAALSGLRDAKAARPNIIFISVDTLRPDFLEPYAPDDMSTPAIAELARDSVRFDQAFSVSPWTMPSHFSIFTGLYPSRHGLNRAFGFNNAVAEPSIRTLAETLRDAGYRTAAIASDHSLDPLYGLDKGFDSFIDLTTRDVQDLLPHIHRFLEREQQEPFFLFLHTYDPHGSLFRTEGLEHLERGRLEDVVSYGDVKGLGEASEEEKRYLRGLYRNHVSYFDRYFGEILEALKRHDLYDDAIIVFTSDHGEELLERSAYLHGHSLHDEVLRVPLLMKFPEGNWPAEVAALMGSIDIFPTLAAYIGVPVPEDLDGTNALPVLKGESRAHRRVLLSEACAWGPERKSVRSQQYRYIWTLAEDEKGGLAPRPTAHASIVSWEPREELFDLLSDPGETRNLWGERQELVKRLKANVELLLAVESPVGTVIIRDANRLEALRSLGYVQD